MPEFLQPTRRSDLFELLQLAREKAEAEGEPLPRRFCVISYGLDLASRDGPKSQSDYARIWGYSRSWVCRNIDDIAAEAEAQRTFYSDEREAGMGKNDTQQPDNIQSTRSQQTDNLNRPRERQNGEKDESSQQSDNIQSTRSQQRDNTNRSHYSDYQNKTSSSASRERAGETPPQESEPPPDASRADPPPPPDDDAPPIPDLDFFTERDEPHRAAVEAAAAKSGGNIGDPYWLAKLSKSAWGRRNALAKYDLDSLLDDHSPPVVLAAIIQAGDDQNPNRGFFHSILERLHEQQQRVEAGKKPDLPKQQQQRSHREDRDGGGSTTERPDFVEGRRGWWPEDPEWYQGGRA
jgi:DNA mismatch repair ATPase MutL